MYPNRSRHCYGSNLASGALTWLSVHAALFLATIGAVSLFIAAQIDKRTLKCP